MATILQQAMLIHDRVGIIEGHHYAYHQFVHEAPLNDEQLRHQADWHGPAA